MVDAKEQDKTSRGKPFFAKWQHVIALAALFVAVVGAGIGVYFQFFARDEARLDVEFLAEVVIADLTYERASNLSLSHGDQTFRNASTVSLLVTNTGRTNLKPLNAQDLGDITNARIRISLEAGLAILEAVAQATGEDASSRLERLESPEKRVATFVVLLMNVDAQVTIDLVVAGVDVVEALDVKVMGEGLKGEFLRSKNEPSVFLGGSMVGGFCAFTALYVAAAIRLLKRLGFRLQRGDRGDTSAGH